MSKNALPSVSVRASARAGSSRCSALDSVDRLLCASLPLTPTWLRHCRCSGRRPLAFDPKHVVQTNAQIQETPAFGRYAPEVGGQRVDVAAPRFAVGCDAAVASPALLRGRVYVQAWFVVLVEGTRDLAFPVWGPAGQQAHVVGWLDLLQRVLLAPLGEAGTLL